MTLSTAVYITRRITSATAVNAAVAKMAPSGWGQVV